MSKQPRQFDAIVIGGGPAGSASAAVLGEYGHRVVVLERAKFPRYHIGESLIPVHVSSPGTSRSDSGNEVLGVRAQI